MKVWNTPKVFNLSRQSIKSGPLSEGAERILGCDGMAVTVTDGIYLYTSDCSSQGGDYVCDNIGPGVRGVIFIGPRAADTSIAQVCS